MRIILRDYGNDMCQKKKNNAISRKLFNIDIFWLADFAVGAPYEGNGVVYIYHGSDEEIKMYSQVNWLIFNAIKGENSCRQVQLGHTFCKILSSCIISNDNSSLYKQRNMLHSSSTDWYTSTSNWMYDWALFGMLLPSIFTSQKQVSKVVRIRFWLMLTQSLNLTVRLR